MRSSEGEAARSVSHRPAARKQATVSTRLQGRHGVSSPTRNSTRVWMRSRDRVLRRDTMDREREKGQALGRAKTAAQRQGPLAPQSVRNARIAP